MHMHVHLKEVIKDYGPVQEFWLFSFERCNIILGKQPSNNKNIEPQSVQWVLNYNVAIPLIESYPNDFSDGFQPLLQSVTSNTLTGSVLETASHELFQLSIYKISPRCSFR